MCFLYPSFLIFWSPNVTEYYKKSAGSAIEDVQKNPDWILLSIIISSSKPGKTKRQNYEKKINKEYCNSHKNMHYIH